MTREITIALAGNPNAGKSTVFNNLTGAHQHVGNWPGVTVEKKEGTRHYQGHLIKVVDLPGVYSLTAYSPDEVVARNFIIEEKPDAVVNIVDASNLERNLYLTLQLLEMGAPLIIALNMMDIAESRKHQIDIAALSREIGAPVVPMVASRNRGTEKLLEEVVKLAERRPEVTPVRIDYGREVENEIDRLEKLISQSPLAAHYSPRWLAVKLLEEDEEIIKKFERLKDAISEEIVKAKDESLAHLRSIYRDDAEIVIADGRYGFISGLVKDILKKPPMERLTLSDSIDKVVVNRWAGIPIFLGLMFLMFQFVFILSTPLMDWMGRLFSWLGGYASGISPDWLESLLADGVIGGLGSVLTFIPPIFLLFIAIAVLEDSGYMARAAFIMDQLMHRIGLHGRSFIPLLMGFGCNIPGVMACRTIQNPRDRMTTILVTPFMSCGARLPIYVLLAGAFFPAYQGLVVFSMYLIGIVVAIIMALILRKSILKGESSHFVMELPPYRLPTLNSVLLHTWERGKSFLARAGTIIFGAAVLVWLLGSLPWGVQYASAESVIGRIGSFIAPIFAPAGFGQWQAAVSLLLGTFAKEIVVSTLGAIFAVEQGILGGALTTQLGWTPLTAYTFMVFSLLYIPCAATIATIWGETRSLRWTAFSVLNNTTVAWLVATLVFQIGRLLI